jgi:NAD(P)H-dependent FMN reductase
MKKVLAMGGSLNRNSLNRRLALYAANMLDDVEVVLFDLNDYPMPIYSVDIQREQGIPENAYKINDIFASVDGFVISLAEHNGNYSTAFKNMFDWVSRIEMEVWKNKPMLLMAASPGGRGGQKVLGIAVEAFRWYGGNVVANFSLGNFNDVFSEDGLKDEVKALELKTKVNMLQDALVNWEAGE